MNKKMIPLFVLLLATLLVVPVFATTTDVDWSGSGRVTVDVYADDDMHSWFDTQGSSIYGQYQMTDLENNPYGYGVDSVSAQVEAGYTGGGYLEFVTERTDSTSMYGVPGEISYTYISSDATGGIQFRTGINYASLGSHNYNWHSNDHFLATSSPTGTFVVEHQLWDTAWYDEGGYFVGVGSGSIDIDYMSEGTWGKTESFQFGKGQGCYTNADVLATGSGSFTLHGEAENQLNVGMLPFSILGDGSADSAMFTMGFTYGSGLTISDISFDGN